MKILRVFILLTFWLWPAASVSAATPAPHPDPVVRALLFYSPTCGHCHYVITEVLPPLFEHYGSQLQVLEVDVTQPDGQALFQTVLQKFNLERGGVPFLVIGNIYLIGSEDIPEQFPGLIEQYLAQGGVDWPDIPGLVETQNTQKPIANATPTTTPTATPIPIVRAVLLYRSTCGHCQQIVEEVIPPLFEEYGNQLQIFGVDVSLPEGDMLYDAAIQHFNIKNIFVPILIVGGHVLVGGVEIQQRFAGIIEEYLGQGGVDWPDIPGLHVMLAAAQPTAALPLTYATPAVNRTVPPHSPEPGGFTPTPGIFLTGEYPSGPVANLALDPLGNSLAVVILLGMVASIIWGITYFHRSNSPVLTIPNWAIPALCIVGLGVAGYLAYVEITQVAAVCGPVGDCNTVQQSEYARLFGILPIGVLGMSGYFMIIAAWVVERFSKGKLTDYTALATLLLTFFGTLFSIYLTFLEPFIIGATCAWCLSSAIIMTALMWLSIASGKLAYNHLFKK